MSDSNEIQPDERLEKRTRRRFSAAEKKRLLAEADKLPHGERGLWLRRNGLYAGQLSTWRRELAEHGEAGLASKAPVANRLIPGIGKSSASSGPTPNSSAGPRWPSS